jgi:hypothetical protein
VNEFKLDNEQRRRLVVQERDSPRGAKLRPKMTRTNSPTEQRCPKKIAEATGNPKIESRHTPLWGPPIGQSSFSVARIFVEAFVGDKMLRKGEVRQPQVCDHCGGRFGLLTHRWWSNKFCKKKCKDAHLRELAFRRDQIRRWYGFLSPGGSRLPS